MGVVVIVVIPTRAKKERNNNGGGKLGNVPQMSQWDVQWIGYKPLLFLSCFLCHQTKDELKESK
jgi:hypothetical protein